MLPFFWEGTLSGFRESPLPVPRGRWHSTEGGPLLLSHCPNGAGGGTRGRGRSGRLWLPLPGIWDSLAGNELGLVAMPKDRVPPELPGSCPPGSPGSTPPSALCIPVSFQKSPLWLVALCPFWFLQLKSPSARCASDGYDHKATRLTFYKRTNQAWIANQVLAF